MTGYTANATGETLVVNCEIPFVLLVTLRSLPLNYWHLPCLSPKFHKNQQKFGEKIYSVDGGGWDSAFTSFLSHLPTFWKIVCKCDSIRKFGPNSSSACHKLWFELYQPHLYIKCPDIMKGTPLLLDKLDQLLYTKSDTSHRDVVDSW